MKTSSIIDIELSPFWISELFPYFFFGYGKDFIEYPIANLITPFVLTKSIREDILMTATVNSSFNSLFFNPSRKSKKRFRYNDDSLINSSCLHDINVKYHANKSITGKAIIIAYEKRYIDLREGKIFPVIKLDYRKNTEAFLRDYYKCANNLGVVFKSEEIKSLFIKCNIRSL